MENSIISNGHSPREKWVDFCGTIREIWESSCRIEGVWFLYGKVFKAKEGEVVLIALNVFYFTIFFRGEEYWRLCMPQNGEFNCGNVANGATVWDRKFVGINEEFCENLSVKSASFGHNWSQNL